MPTQFGTYHSHLYNVEDEQKDCSIKSAQLLAHVMCQYDSMSKGKNSMSKKKLYQLAHTCSLKREIIQFGEELKKSVYKELQQLNDRVVFKPVRVETLTTLEQKRIMESLIFLA